MAMAMAPAASAAPVSPTATVSKASAGRELLRLALDVDGGATEGASPGGSPSSPSAFVAYAAKRVTVSPASPTNSNDGTPGSRRASASAAAGTAATGAKADRPRLLNGVHTASSPPPRTGSIAVRPAPLPLKQRVIRPTSAAALPVQRVPCLGQRPAAAAEDQHTRSALALPLHHHQQQAGHPQQPSTPAAGGRWRAVAPPGSDGKRRAAKVQVAPPCLALKGLQLMELPVEMLQFIMDLLPTFSQRARLCLLCTIARRLEWRLAPPLRLDEELSGIGLGNLGARAVALAAASPLNAGLGELCLGDNSIGDAGVQALAAVLASPGSALRRLSLRDNAITEIGARILAAAMRTNVMLEELDFWGNPVPDDAKREILASAKCEVFLALDRLAPAIATVQNSLSVNGKMRAILFDWISQVHTGVNAPVALDGAPDPQDMLFRTFSHVDAYFGLRHVHRGELQLAGVACTLVAAGVDSGSAVEDQELASWLAFVTDGACTAEEVREAARDMHNVLGFKMHQPTAYTFLRRYLRRTGWTEESFSLANYLIELAAIDSYFGGFQPQAVAAAAAVLSRQYVHQGITVRHMPRWKTKLLRCAHVGLREELAPCLAAMSRLHAAQHGQTNMFVNKKYEWARLHAVAKIAPNTPSDTRQFVRYLRSEAAVNLFDDHR